MSQITIWHGLEREVRATGNVRLFSKAQERHPVLRDYATLADAIASVSPKDEAHRNAVLGAMLAESLDGRGAVWAASLALALRPMLVGLIKGVAVRAEDAEAEVLAHFLHSATRIRSFRHIALRLYAETRRRTRAPIQRAQRDEALLDRDVDVDAIEQDEPSSIEEHIDQARFVRRALTAPRADRERFDRYVGRVRGLRQPDWRERSRVYRALGSKESRAEELSILCERVEQVA